MGAPAYEDPRIEDVPQVEANLDGLSGVFTDPLLGGFPPEHCLTVPSDSGIAQVGDLLHEAAEAAQDLLLFYYAGHGLLGRSGELHLAVHGTRLHAPDYSALRFDIVRGTFLDSPARKRVVIVDCCYSGRAIGTALGEQEAAVLGQLEIEGTYTLTSAPPNSLALVRPGESYTAFTGRLLSLLRTGIASAGETLSLGELYRQLYLRLKEDGLPLPQQRGTATADRIGLVRNRRPAPPEPAELPADIAEGLESRFPGLRQGAVNELAGWLGDPDPRRVRAARITLERAAAQDNPLVAGTARAQLATRWGSATAAPAAPDGELPPRPLAELVRIAEAITAEQDRDSALSDIAREAISGDPDLATRAAHHISGPERQTTALAQAVRRLAVAQPLAALGVAHTIVDGAVQAQALTTVVGVLAKSDPDIALRVAEGIGVAAEHAKAIGAVMQAVAPQDPASALRIADNIPDVKNRAAMSRSIAAQVALLDVDLGLGLLNGPTTSKAAKAQCMAEIALALAPSDPDRSVQIAREAEQMLGLITNSFARANAMVQVGRALAALDPGRAAELGIEALRIGDAEAGVLSRGRLVRRATDLVLAVDPPLIEAAVALVAREGGTYLRSLMMRRTAAIDVELALRVAGGFDEPRDKDNARCEIARRAASADMDRALRIADSISGFEARARALSLIARDVAGLDPDRALAVAEGIPGASTKAAAVVEIAETAGSKDPALAAHIATGIALDLIAVLASPLERAELMTRVLAAVGGCDRGRALEIAEDVLHLLAVEPDPAEKLYALGELARAVAKIDLPRGRRIAAEAVFLVEGSEDPAEMLSCVVESIVEVDELIARAAP